MPGIYIMAIVTVAVALAMVGGAILFKARRADRPLFVVALLLSLPLAAGAFYFLRIPIDTLVRGIGLDRQTYLLVTSVYAPLTEEPAKLLPLLLPFLHRHLTRDNAVRIGLALGLGFGLGEVAFLAWKTAQAPAAAGLPWFAFTGFLQERLLVCFLHGAFVATTLWLWFRGVRWGILVAMLLHYLLNLPIFLAILGLFGTDRGLFLTVASVWVLVMAILMALAVVYFLAAGQGVRRVLRPVKTCPGCGERYKPSLFGLNFGPRRYERCPHCRKWHWMPSYGEPEGEEKR